LLHIDLEYRKGILFIRILGDLCKKNYNMKSFDLIKIVKKSGIKYVVLNIEELENIDLFGLNLINKIKRIIKLNNGKILECGKFKSKTFKVIRNILFKDIDNIKNELMAFKIINI